ncbi:hypothetical protein V8C43DRAFT_288031 [Trichoderma afarasin]
MPKSHLKHAPSYTLVTIQVDGVDGPCCILPSFSLLLRGRRNRFLYAGIGLDSEGLDEDRMLKLMEQVKSKVPGIETIKRVTL